MPNYEIIDWYYDKILDEDDLTRIDKIEKKIEANDSKGTADLWMQGSANWRASKSKKTGRTFQNLVDTKNEAQKTLIQDEITSAETEEELKDIKIGDYEDDTVNELTESIDEKLKDLKEELAEPITAEIDGKIIEIPEKFKPGRPIEEVREIVESLAGEFIASIQEAQAKEDLTALNALKVPAGPKEMRSLLQESLDDSIDSVEGVLEAKAEQAELEEE